jgi:hypothetical protein
MSKTIRSAFAALCLASATIPVAGTADAAHRHGGSFFYDRQPAAPGDEYGKQGGRYCRHMCAEDRNPCDPIQFKIADGRCDPFD